MKSFVIVLLVICAAGVKAQTVDYNKIVLPDQIKPNNFEDKLVQLAWKNHPSNKLVLKDVDISMREAKLVKWKWLDDIYATGNLNEFTLSPAGDRPANVFFPRYNFGVRVSIGTFANTSANSKIAKERVLKTNYTVNEKKLSVREEVLTNLEKLKLTYKSFRLRESIKEDYLLMYRESEKKFSTGNVTMEQYRSAVQAYADQVETVLEAESAFNTARITLEAFVGVPLTEVEGYNDLIKRLDAESKLN
ncbi:MAG TPA: TolC family protein [Cyclobacteriaceae bacterium]|nr:TolC family protein [Cyclobacteriaceae bacterium]